MWDCRNQLWAWWLPERYCSLCWLLSLQHSYFQWQSNKLRGFMGIAPPASSRLWAARLHRAYSPGWECWSDLILLTAFLAVIFLKQTIFISCWCIFGAMLVGGDNRRGKRNWLNGPMNLIRGRICPLHFIRVLKPVLCFPSKWSKNACVGSY